MRGVNQWNPVEHVTCERYDISLNRWLSLPSMILGRDACACVRIGSFIYAIGGGTGFHASTASVERLRISHDYDSTDNSNANNGNGSNDDGTNTSGNVGKGKGKSDESENHSDSQWQWHHVPALTLPRALRNHIARVYDMNHIIIIGGQHRRHFPPLNGQYMTWIININDAFIAYDTAIANGTIASYIPPWFVLPPYPVKDLLHAPSAFVI